MLVYYTPVAASVRLSGERVGRMKAVLAVPPLFAVLALLVAGCGGGSSTSSDVVAELRRVATVEHAKPTLVFVYTDG